MKRNQSLKVLEHAQTTLAETEVTGTVSRDAVSTTLGETASKTESTRDGDLFDQLFPPSAPPPPAAATPHGGTVETAKGVRVIDVPHDSPLWVGVQDPREELTRDHLVWVKLLRAAFARDGHDAHGIFGRLNGARCVGAFLERRADRYYIVRGAADEEEWLAARVALGERQEAIVALLTEAKR